MTAEPHIHVPARRGELLDSPDLRRVDARLILASLHATAEWERATGRPSNIKPLRELIWFVWEQPRLPRPLYKSKYPLSVPWTPAARAAYEVDGPVSLEHVMPAAVLVRRLIADPPGNAASLVRILRSIEYVVIAPDDNRRLMAARVGSKLPPGSSDPWDRYRKAGLDLATLTPIEVM